MIHVIYTEYIRGENQNALRQGNIIKGGRKENTRKRRRWPGVVLMLGRRRRRRPNIKTTPVQRLGVCRAGRLEGKYTHGLKSAVVSLLWPTRLTYPVCPRRTWPLTADLFTYSTVTSDPRVIRKVNTCCAWSSRDICDNTGLSPWIVCTSRWVKVGYTWSSTKVEPMSCLHWAVDEVCQVCL